MPPALGGPTLVVLDGGGGCEAMMKYLAIQHAMMIVARREMICLLGLYESNMRLQAGGSESSSQKRGGFCLRHHNTHYLQTDLHAVTTLKPF